MHRDELTSFACGVEKDPDPCPICSKHLSSIITRRIGDIAVCADCGDKLIPLMNALAAFVVGRCAAGISTGERSLSAIIQGELDFTFNHYFTYEQRCIIEASL